MSATDSNTCRNTGPQARSADGKGPQASIFCLWSIKVELSQHHLLILLIFPPLNALSEDQLTLYLWVYFWTLFFSIDLSIYYVFKSMFALCC